MQCSHQVMDAGFKLTSTVLTLQRSAILPAICELCDINTMTSILNSADVLLKDTCVTTESDHLQNPRKGLFRYNLSE